MSSAPTFSVEFFPPKDEAGEARLWRAVDEIAGAKPDFVSVTYGAGGSTRDRTIRCTSEITARTGFPTIAHLTCVGSTKSEISTILDQYSAAGIKSILALRGDPQGGPRAPWVPIENGFNHSDELVSLAYEKGFEVGVAAFPDGHPASQGDFAKDIDVLLEKERRGATFATTQFFFSTDRYSELVERLQKRGSNLDIYPGVLPITNISQLTRMAELSGTPIPSEVLTRITAGENDPNKVRAIGIEIAIELCEKLLHNGVPGIHFYTMNSASSTLEIVKRIGLR
ncbi:MAG: methylenetetrahydrofolate reductase [NAD(P)H] [Actinobacteria bacterium]|jgi:methylenetetrahydrofolate reductase (NADPH)|nr:methylenetetrahydrofolate reductase [NAD(P)H] [Actinomycetota bacterium]NCU89136.1 methylenetetrahydrofolate reductase [NAD(P)H] [Actinomycetota bacterium]NDE53099.1 methylenetetrahydrofolate reductase [NAD(P)H] [Actinomycetota bacterium]